MSGRPKKRRRSQAEDSAPQVCVPGHRDLRRRSEGRLHGVAAFVVTADEFPGELGESYPAACAALRVQPAAKGYGVVLAQDDLGARWTQVSTEVGAVESLLALEAEGMGTGGYVAEDDDVMAVWAGWPLDCSIEVVDVAAAVNPPRQHDPPGVDEDEVLRPPPPGWTPQRRRGMADTMAAELANRMGRSYEDYIDAYRNHQYMYGNFELVTPPPRLIDMRQPLAVSDSTGREVVDRALTDAWALAEVYVPPVGSIRLRKTMAWSAEAVADDHANEDTAARSTGLGRLLDGTDSVREDRTRVVRAEGAGWTLVGRTDHPVVLLVDEIPDVILDIGDTKRLGGLLDALIAAAARVPTDDPGHGG